MLETKNSLSQASMLNINSLKEASIKHTRISYVEMQGIPLETRKQGTFTVKVYTIAPAENKDQLYSAQPFKHKLTHPQRLILNMLGHHIQQYIGMQGLPVLPYPCWKLGSAIGQHAKHNLTHSQRLAFKPKYFYLNEVVG